MFRTSNPVLKPEVFRPDHWRGNDVGAISSATNTGTMTMQGVAIKTGILTVILATSAGVTAAMVGSTPGLAMIGMLGGMLVSFVLGLIMYFSPRTSPFVAPFYAVAQGAFLGVLTLFYAKKFQLGKVVPADMNLIGQAVGLTIAVAGGVSIAFAMRIIRLGSTAKKVIFSAIVGLSLFSLAQMLLTMVFKVQLFSALYGNGMIGIGFSLVCVALAALTLVWEFQTVEEGVEAGAPKFMEWYSAYGILVSIVWLYVEILRLLSKLRDR